MSGPPLIRPKEPKLIARSVDVHGADNFPVGCQFSPDGLCLLTSTGADSRLRLYNTVLESEREEDATNDAASVHVHEWKAALSVSGGNAVRSYHWYPLMRSDDPASCCFLASAR
jgi:hypothetical protein